MAAFPLIQPLRQRWRGFLLVHALFSALGIILLTPLFGLLLQGLVSLSGEPAVADQDIARLLLSPAGMLGGVLVFSVLLAITGLELGALQRVSAAALRGTTTQPLQAVGFALYRAPALLRLTLWLTLRVLAYLLPYLAVIGAIAWFLLTDYDINYYLSQRPPAFYYALAAAAPPTIALLLLLGRRLLDWSLALPLTLFANTSPRQAFGESERLLRGRRREVLTGLGRWLLMAAALSLVPTLCLDLLVDLVLATRQESLSALLFLLGGAAMIWGVLGFLVTALNLAGFTLVVASLYERYGPGLSEQVSIVPKEATAAALQRVSPVRIGLGAAVLALAAGATGAWLLGDIDVDDQVLIVAHRGAAGAAPENTLASVEQALTDGTDWVEIDVQETRDGQVVVVHDSDFMKLAGDPLKVWEGDLAQVQALDVGSWFDPGFAGQRVPLLSEVLDAVRGRARLVIELKYYGHDQRLEQRVVDLVEDAGMADQVAIMSLKLPGVQKVQALRPGWHTGLLAATALGDLSRLEVDFLAVNANMASPGFIRRAHRAGKKVLVWTVNDALSLSKWMSAGIDGVITDEPALARSILQQRADLSSVERLLLSAALLFGKPQVVNRYRDNSP